MLIFNTILVVVFAIQRLVELAISKRHQRILRGEGARPVRDPVFPLMILTHVVLLGGTLVEPWMFDRPFVPWIGWPAFVVLVAAQVLRFWVLRTLGRHWNVTIMASGEQGIVSSGPYRFVRHPNYVVVVLEGIFLPLFHSAYLTLFVTQLLHLPVIAKRVRAEEDYLLSVPEYRRVMAGRPRFLPRLGSGGVDGASRAG